MDYSARAGRDVVLADLTHPIVPGMPVYPGTAAPVFGRATTVEANGFAETLISMYSHTGTHVDAPSHMLAGAPSLDRLDPGRFVGRACVIDAAAPGLATIGVPLLEGGAELVSGCRFVLFHTGWSRYWGDARYFSGFPVLSADAARWLAARELHGVGFDAISADPVDAPTFENHLVFFGAGMLIVENLTGLAPLVGRTFLFSCLPLKFGDADGSPVRAVAIL